MYTIAADVLNLFPIKLAFVSRTLQGFKLVLTNYLHSEYQLDLNLLSYKIQHDEKKKKKKESDRLG